jgi:hypothetical protein
LDSIKKKDNNLIYKPAAFESAGFLLVAIVNGYLNNNIYKHCLIKGVLRLLLKIKAIFLLKELYIGT